MVRWKDEVYLEENIPWIYDFETTADLRGYDYIAFDAIADGAEEDMPVALTAALIPLQIGRPEFYPEHKAEILISRGIRQRVYLEFKQFDFAEAADAFLRYVSQITFGSKERIRITNLRVGHFGDFDARIPIASMS
ncbi:MAG: hypothetical protein K0S76_1526 [Herbinix sp.]|jgi:hypothetical protein|nr:hypothetical protein [Herbinix sp.]MDF2870047.1 hypothetical protein [Anaerocolumna sp.]